MDKTIIKGLASKLEQYANIDLNPFFVKLRCDCPGISREDQNRLHELDPFESQLELKKLVGVLLRGSFENWDVNAWIVHQWGGIRLFNISKHERITGFRDNLLEGRTAISEFDRISSLSKIASFVSQDRFFIYDSRVAFSLNGFLLMMKQENEKLPISFFPLPSAQGGRDMRMRRLISQLYPDAVYLTKEETYSEYNSLILNLSKEKSLDRQLPPCWIEMLLFALGKTKGEVERQFDFSQISAETNRKNNAKRKQKKAIGGESKNESLTVSSLSNGRKLRNNRIVLYGNCVQYEGHMYYLFVGEKPSFHYLELLTQKGVLLDDNGLVQELERRGFKKRGNDYIYKPLKPYNEHEAKQLLEEIIKWIYKR